VKIVGEIQTLSRMDAGEEGVIRKIEGGYGLQKRLACLGLRVGKTVKKITSEPLRGPVVVEVDGTHVAIGRGMAEKILVEVS
jgi:ferrous iron transport protein A